MSLIKLAIEGGARSDLPNVWKTKGINLGARNNIPLATGLFKLSNGIPKISETIQ